jgi:hypothetical protein
LQHPLFLDALQAPFQKIDFQCLLADLALQFSDPAFRPARLPVAREGVAWPWRNSRRQRCKTLGLTSNARAASVIETPCPSRRTAASLNSFVNNLT